MTENQYESGAPAELTPLLVALVLGDATDEQLARLNDLLQSDVDARHRAARFLEEEVVLRQQFQVLSRVDDFHRPPVELPHAVSAAKCTADADRAAPQSVRRRGVRYVLPVSLLATLAVAALWIQSDWNSADVRAIGDSADSMPLGVDHERALITFKENAVLPRVTRVSWAGPQFASDFEPRQLASTLREGVTLFSSVNGWPAHGYMICLPSGALLELVVAADAEGENALSVIEFDREGRPTGRRISFSNNIAEAVATTGLPNVAPALTRFGPIGTWAERNNSSSSRYFFFTCVHKLVDQSADDSWHVSRLSVMLDDSNLTHIGWDDSGLYRGVEGDHVPDDDYDDLSATIRIHGSDGDSSNASSGLRVLPGLKSSNGDPAETGIGEIDANELMLQGEVRGFPIAVEAGETVVLKVSNRASVPISIAVVEKKTGHAKWICDHVQPRLANIGFCAVENNTSTTQEYMLVCRFKSTFADANEPWQASNHAVVSKQNAFVSVGFESGQDDADLENVKVDLIRLSSL